MNNEEKIIDLENQVAILKIRLHNTDYITDKFTEAIVKYIVADDKSKVFELYNEYQSKIEERETWRAEINELEREKEELKLHNL